MYLSSAISCPLQSQIKLCPPDSWDNLCKKVDAVLETHVTEIPGLRQASHKNQVESCENFTLKSTYHHMENNNLQSSDLVFIVDCLLRANCVIKKFNDHDRNI